MSLYVVSDVHSYCTKLKRTLDNMGFFLSEENSFSLSKAKLTASSIVSSFKRRTLSIPSSIKDAYILPRARALVQQLVEGFNPERTYSSDDYNFSSDAFYRKYTNCNAISQYENVFSLAYLWRISQMLSFESCENDPQLQLLCSLEAHDCDRVQGQRPGEFYFRRSNRKLVIHCISRNT